MSNECRVISKTIRTPANMRSLNTVLAYHVGRVEIEEGRKSNLLVIGNAGVRCTPFGNPDQTDYILWCAHEPSLPQFLDYT